MKELLALRKISEFFDVIIQEENLFSDWVVSKLLFEDECYISNLFDRGDYYSYIDLNFISMIQERNKNIHFLGMAIFNRMKKDFFEIVDDREMDDVEIVKNENKTIVKRYGYSFELPNNDFQNLPGDIIWNILLFQTIINPKLFTISEDVKKIVENNFETVIELNSLGFRNTFENFYSMFHLDKKLGALGDLNSLVFPENLDFSKIVLVFNVLEYETFSILMKRKIDDIIKKYPKINIICESNQDKFTTVSTKIIQINIKTKIYIYSGSKDLKI
jgi:hypothetical protein